jgi:hypothetical protein
MINVVLVGITKYCGPRFRSGLLILRVRYTISSAIDYVVGMRPFHFAGRLFND